MTASLKKQLGGEFFTYDLKVYYICPECRAEEEQKEERREE